ncbi:restriction endonuclease subunit S [Streptomyces ardesiacus]|uniref:restriction endonuclease subunit S n=1 Tax=Streptomyces ardesiacus TaxID=285564 RepID=UPI00201F3AA5|nr:restriction endonuclease subunit S [Streptomyces ardesiacus]MCL7369650.1 restriction endonuclease subunit S [Streptomyces ardesiacus]
MSGGPLTAAVPWLDTIPAGWSITKLGRTARIGNGSTPRRDNREYWDHGVVPWLNSSVVNQARVDSSAESVAAAALAECHLPIVSPGSVLVGLTGQGRTRGMATILDIEATVNQHLAYVTPDRARWFPDFLLWFLTAAYDDLRRISEENGSTKGGLTCEALKQLRVLVPPIDEQRAIADYLDRETARIDTLIEEQQQLIKMLRDRRFALRVNVALRGTTPTEEVESPLPWAKTLPAAWRVVPLTSVAALESGHTPSRSREDWWQDCYIPWVSLHDVGIMRGVKYLNDTTQHISDAGIANSSARLLPARTVVLSRDATVGRTAIMGVPMATSQHFAAWVCGPDLDPEYLWVLFEDAMQPFFDSFQNGSTIRTIGMGDLKTFRIPLPPLDEQRRIVEYLDEETVKIDSLITETERFVELSRERRSALITAAVTGQIDVREVA